MKSVASRIVLVVIFALFIQGCATTVTQLSREPINSDKITFIIPKNVDIAYVDENLKGLRFKNEIERGQPLSPGGPIPVNGVDITAGGTTWTFYKGEIYFDVNHIERRIASSVIYNVTANASENNSSYLVTLQPTEKEVIKGTGTYGDAFPIPDYSPDDLLHYLCQPTIEYRTEIDSPYNTESVYANFKRSLKSETFANGYRDPVTGKIFGDAFTLQSEYGEDTVKLYVLAYPYKNGSKVVIRVSLTLSSGRDERTIDVGKKINAIDQELAKIVKS